MLLQPPAASELSTRPTDPLETSATSPSSPPSNVNRLKDCVLPKIEEECGEDALSLVRLVIERSVGRTLTVACRGFEPAGLACTSLLPPAGTKPHSK